MTRYEITKADMLRLVALLQRQPLGVRFDGSRLRVTEPHSGDWTVTDVEFRRIKDVEGRRAR